MENIIKFTASRRHFLCQGGALAAAAALLGPAGLLAAEKKEKDEVEVTPTEDLMREHGVLHRLMLIFDESAKRLQGAADFPPGLMTRTTKIIRTFIQDYHEKNEEDSIFPRFNQAGKMMDLVKVLKEQHDAGRKAISVLEAQATSDNLKNQTGREKIRSFLLSFNRMYRPHAAWEDTVLYPAFRSVISPKEFEGLGDQFEDKEHKLFGKNGLEKIVAEVAELEKQLGLYDLAQFTPKE